MSARLHGVLAAVTSRAGPRGGILRFPLVQGACVAAIYQSAEWRRG